MSEWDRFPVADDEPAVATLPAPTPQPASPAAPVVATPRRISPSPAPAMPRPKTWDDFPVAEPDAQIPAAPAAPKLPAVSATTSPWDRFPVADATPVAAPSAPPVAARAVPTPPADPWARFPLADAPSPAPAASDPWSRFPLADASSTAPSAADPWARFPLADAGPTAAPPAPAAPVDPAQQELDDLRSSAAGWGFDPGVALPVLMNRYLKRFPQQPKPGASTKDQDAYAKALAAHMRDNPTPEIFDQAPANVRKWFTGELAKRGQLGSGDLTPMQIVGRDVATQVKEFPDNAKSVVAGAAAGLAEMAHHSAQFAAPNDQGTFEPDKGPSPTAEHLRGVVRETEAGLTPPDTLAGSAVRFTGRTGVALAPALAAGAVAGPAGAAMVGAAQMAGDVNTGVYESLIAQGHSPEEASKIANLAGLGGGAVGAVTGGLVGGGGGSVVKGAARKLIEHAAEGAALGGIQAGATTAIEHAATGKPLDLMSIPANAGVGAAISVGLNLVGAALSRGKVRLHQEVQRHFEQRVREAKSPEEVRAVVQQADDLARATEQAEGTPQTAAPSNRQSPLQSPPPRVGPSIESALPTSLGTTDVMPPPRPDLRPPGEFRPVWREGSGYTPEAFDVLVRDGINEQNAKNGIVQGKSGKRYELVVNDDEAGRPTIKAYREVTNNPAAAPTPQEPGVVPQPVYKPEELARMQKPTLRRQAEQWQVPFDTRSATLPRLASAQERWRLEQLTPKQLWDQVRAKGLRAGSRDQNIETLLSAGSPPPVQPATASPQPSPFGTGERQPTDFASMKFGELYKLAQRQGVARPPTTRNELVALLSRQPEASPAPSAPEARPPEPTSFVPADPDLLEPGQAVSYRDERGELRHGSYQPSSGSNAWFTDQRGGNGYPVPASQLLVERAGQPQPSPSTEPRAPVAAPRTPPAETDVMRSGRAESPAPAAEPASPRPARPAPAPTGFTRRAVRQRIQEAYTRQGGGVPADVHEFANTLQDPFTFGPNLRGEVEQHLGREGGKEGIAIARSGAVKFGPSGGGEDALGAFKEKWGPKGEELYWQLVRERAGLGFKDALEHARGSQDPEVKYLAALHDTMPAASERPPQDAVDPRSLPMGQEFETNGITQRVTTDGDGTRILQDGGDLPEVPVDALGKVPVDRGTMREGARPTEALSTGTLAAGGGKDLYGNATFEARPGETERFGFGQDDAAARRERAKTYSPDIERRQLEPSTGRTETDQRIAEQYDPSQTPGMFQHPADRPATPERAGFTTEKGSTYTVEGQSTTRTKTPHEGHDPADVGLKTPSERTVYVSPEFAREVGMWGTGSMSGKRIALSGDKVGLISDHPTTGKPGRDVILSDNSFSTEPRVGLHPLELWGKGKAGEVYSSSHPGSRITEVRGPGETAPARTDTARTGEPPAPTAGREFTPREVVYRQRDAFAKLKAPDARKRPTSATAVLAKIYGETPDVAAAVEKLQASRAWTKAPGGAADRYRDGLTADLRGLYGEAPPKGRGGGLADRIEPSAAGGEEFPAKFEAKPATVPGASRTLRPVQMPELVKLAEGLMGQQPEINARMRTNRGVFKPAGGGAIDVNPSIASDPYQLAKTLAHEVGHLIDFLNDNTLARGNLLARVKSLKPMLVGLYKMRGFLKDSFGDGGPTNTALRKELMDLSGWWRPGDMSSAYRKSSKELYADAMSVLLNSPGELQSRAPQFFSELMKHLDAKPGVFKSLMDLQDALAGTPAELAAARRQDIREAFSSAEDAIRARATERQEVDDSIVSQAQQLLYDAARPITDLTHGLVRERGWTPENLAARYAMDELGYANNVNHLMLRRMQSDVVEPAKAAGLSLDDLGEYLMMRRVQGDRAGIANPFGHTPETAGAQLQDLRGKLGPEKWAALETAAGKFHDVVFESVERAVEVGTYGRDVFEERIKPNRDTYAAFGVVDHLNDTMPAGIKEQIGTFKPIGNPFTLTVMKTISLNRLNELQAAKNTVRDWLKTNFEGEIQGPYPADRNHTPPKAPPGHEHLIILEDGKPQAYIVDTYIAKMYQHRDIGMLAKAARLMGMATYFRHPLYITGSPGFQVTNVFRDLRRTWTNMGALHGTSFRDVIKAYWDAKGTAWKRARGVDDATINQMLKEKALDAPFSRYTFGSKDDARADDGTYARMLEEYGLAEPTKARKFFNRTLGRVLRAAETVGTFIETVPKVAGYRLIAAAQGGYDADGVPVSERSYQVRNYVGTPNLRRRGLATDLTNGVLMYSNAFLQGARADAELALFRPGSRSGYAVRRFMIDVLPRIIQKAAVAGAFGVGVKAMLDRVSDSDKANYTVIPLGVTGDDDEKKTAYLRIPHDETGRFLGTLAWAVLDAPGSGVWKGIQNFVSQGYAGLPGWSPILSEGYNWAQYAAGKNPRDNRGREIIPRDEFAAGGMPALKRMLKWEGDQWGIVSEVARMFQKGDGRPKTTTEAIIGNIPGLSRLVKFSDTGVREDQWETIAAEDAEAARFRLGLPDEVKTLVKDRYRLSRLGADNLQAHDIERLTVLDGFYRKYLKLTKQMKAAQESHDDASVTSLRGQLSDLAKQSAKGMKPETPEEKDAQRRAAAGKIARSGKLSADEQDKAYERTGIERPLTLDLDRELKGLRSKKKAFDDAMRTARDKPAERQQALEAVRANRLSTDDAGRLQRLENIHRNVAAVQKQIEAGTVSRQEGEQRIKLLLKYTQKKPAA